MKIVEYPDRPAEFWALMGPFFAQRKYRREMPYLVDDEGYVWFLAMDGDILMGFVAVHAMKDHAVVSGLYVREDRRGNGLAKKLIAACLKWSAGEKILKVKTTASPDSRPVFGKMGFSETGQKGQYVTMEVILNADSFRDGD